MQTRNAVEILNEWRRLVRTQDLSAPTMAAIRSLSEQFDAVGRGVLVTTTTGHVLTVVRLHRRHGQLYVAPCGADVYSILTDDANDARLA